MSAEVQVFKRLLFKLDLLVIIFDSSHLGSGKSHVLDSMLVELKRLVNTSDFFEALQYLEKFDTQAAYQLIKARLNNCIHIPISFSGDTPIRSGESIDPIVSRMLYS